MNNSTTKPATLSFTVWRGKWLRGEGAGELLTDDGRMCCLGFASLAAGCEEYQIRGLCYPDEISEAPSVLDALRNPHGANNAQCLLLAETNDGVSMTSSDREAKLRGLFKSIGWDVTFADGDGPFGESDISTTSCAPGGNQTGVSVHTESQEVE